MTNQELIEELQQLSNTQRLAVIEAATRLIQRDLSENGNDEIGRRLAAAAEAMLPDYSTDKELTAFTSLDSEEFRSA